MSRHYVAVAPVLSFGHNVAMRGRLHRVSWALLVAAGLSGVGCGKSTAGQTLVLSAVEDHLAAASTYQTSSVVKVYDTANPDHVEEAGTGTAEYDLARQAAHIKTSYRIVGAAAPTGPGFAAGTDGRTESIAIGNDQWIMGLSPTGAVISDGTPLKPWTHVRSLRPLVSVQQSLMADFAALPLDGKASLVGHDTIEGVRTSRYQAHLPAYGLSTVEVWLDDAERLRQFRMVVSVKAQPDSTPPIPDETMVYTVTIHAVGEPVTISPPPSDQISELPPSASSSSGYVTCTNLMKGHNTCSTNP